jgi:hypothetical protein
MKRWFSAARAHGALAPGALLAAALAAGAVPSVATAAPVSFAPAQSFPANANPVYVVAADLNRDGKLDLAVANGAPTNTVSILLGNGSGGFGMPTTIPVNDPAAIAVGDFNGDNNPDLAVTSLTGQSVSIFTGNGSGTFTLASGSPIPLGSPVQGIAAGELTGDAALDLAVTVPGTNAVQVLKGNGNATFSLLSPLAVGSMPVAVAVGNLDGNAFPDLVTANIGDNTISRLLGVGGGGFSVAMPFTSGTNPDSVFIADLNRDGNADVVNSNQAAGTASVFLGNGAGGLASPKSFPIGSQPFLAAPSDLNGDGILDLAAANRIAAGGASVILGNGDGTFGPPAFSSTGTNASWAAVGDFNGDGRPDLAVVNKGDANVSILLNTTVFPPPVATTGGASAVTQTTATLSGAVTPHGQPATFKFQIGTTTAYGRETAPQSAGSGLTPVSAAQAVTGLQPGTTYHYRIAGTDRFGTSFGADATFTTASGPPPPPPPPPPPVSPLKLSRAVFVVKWRQSRVTGLVRFTGTATQRLSISARLRRPGKKTKVLASRRLAVRAGTFRGSLLLPHSLLPGAYRLELVAGKVASSRSVGLKPPPEGVVRSAGVNTRPGGAPLARIRGRPKVLFATFVFAARPRRGQRITTTWVQPTDVPTPAVGKGFLPILTSVVGTTDAATPLQPGPWRCVLRAGGRTVAVASTRVG